MLTLLCVFIDKPSSSNTSPAQSPSQHDIINNNTIILASSISTGLLLLLLLVITFVVIISIVCAANAIKQKQHTSGIMHDQ